MPESRHTNVLCPLCSTYLSRPVDSEQSGLPNWFFECTLCDTRFKRVGFIHRPREWAWITAGAVLFTLAIVILIALAIGKNSTCADLRFDGEYFCADGGPANTWFDTGGARAIRISLLFGVIVAIPAAFAYLTARYVWLLFLPIALVTGLVTGILLGEWMIQRWYPDLYWKDPGHPTLVAGCTLCGAPMMCLVAFLTLEVAASRSPRLQLKRLQHDTGEWPFVCGA